MCETISVNIALCPDVKMTCYFIFCSYILILHKIWSRGFDQVADLVSAMMFIRESGSDTPRKLVPVRKPRFRPTVIAVIAARRLITWSAVSCRRMFPPYGSHLVAPLSNVMCVGDISHAASSVSQHKSWFSSRQLQSVILAAVSGLKSATEGKIFFTCYLFFYFISFE